MADHRNPVSEYFAGIDLLGIFDKAATIGMLFAVVIVAGFLMFLFFRYKRNKRQGAFKELVWWEEINGQLAPVRTDRAKEIVVPGTNLRLFYVKNMDLWLPRFTRGLTPNLFYIAVTKNKELINFTLGGLEDDLRRAGLTHDHTDMRWASENLREFVKRNYRDKATPWWKEYSQVISTAIFILVMTVSLATIIYFLRGVVQDIGIVTASLDTAIAQLNVCAPGSGVILK